MKPKPSLSPLAPLEALKPSPAPKPSPKPPEKVLPEKPLPGNGYPLLVDALAKIYTASVTATHEIHKALASPGTPLGAEGIKFVRKSWPAIQELEQAALSETFAAVGSNTLDFGRLDTVVSAALAIAHMESATRVPLGREAVRMTRVGHALAGSGQLLEAAVGLAQARKAEKWLKTSLEKEPWNVEELAWLAGELDGLIASRGSLAVAKLSTGSDERAEKHKAGYAKTLDAERHELDELCKLAHDKAIAAGKKGT